MHTPSVLQSFNNNCFSESPIVAFVFSMATFFTLAGGAFQFLCSHFQQIVMRYAILCFAKWLCFTNNQYANCCSCWFLFLLSKIITTPKPSLAFWFYSKYMGKLLVSKLVI